MVVPSPPFFHGPKPEMEPLGKESLRRAALDARKAFVRTLSDGERALLEQRLAQHLTSLCVGAKVVAGYAPLGSEISPSLAIEEARAVGRIVASPAFDHPAKPFRFRAGDPLDRRTVRNDAAQSENAGGRARPDPCSADRCRRPRHAPRPRQRALRSRAGAAAEGRSAPCRDRLEPSAAQRNDTRATNGTFRSTPSPRRTGSSSSAQRCEA